MKTPAAVAQMKRMVLDRTCSYNIAVNSATLFFNSTLLRVRERERCDDKSVTAAAAVVVLVKQRVRKV